MKINGYRQKSAFVPTGPLLGAHFSISGGYPRAVAEAVRLGCPVFQVFTKNASTWREKQVDEDEAALFRQACRRAGIISVAAHAGYLINLASPDTEKWHRSRSAMENEIERASRLGIELLVFHPGNHMGAGIDKGIARIVAALKPLLELAAGSKVRLLLETTAGQGTGIGHRFEHLAQIVDALGEPEQVGACLDTCHVFAAGYDLRTEEAFHETMETFDRVIGLERLGLLHLNDSLKPLGSRIDRHAHIGRGHIGTPGFACLMNHPRLANIAKILETPKGGDGDWDQTNLEMLRSMVRPVRRW